MPSAELKAIFSADTTDLRAKTREAEAELARLRKAGGGNLAGDLRGGESFAAWERSAGVSGRIRTAWAALGAESAKLRGETDALAARFPTLREQIGNTPAGFEAASAGTARLATRLEKTRGSFLGITNGSSEMMKHLLGLGGITTVTGFVKSAVDLAGQISEASQRTGMSIGNWQRLNYAARKTGTNMNEVEGAFRRLQAVVGGDITDKQEAAFQRLGLSVAQLQAMTPDELFAAVAGAVARIPDPTQRAAAAVEIFGKSGTAILPMSTNLKELGDQAERMGVVMTDASVQTASAFNERMAGLKLTLQNTVLLLMEATSAAGEFWGTVASGRTITTAAKDEIAAKFGGAVTAEQIEAARKARRQKTGEKTAEEQQAADAAARNREQETIAKAMLDRDRRMAAAQQKADAEARRQRADTIAEIETAARKLADARRKLADARRIAAGEATVSRKSGDLKAAEDAVKAAEKRLKEIDDRIKAAQAKAPGGHTRVGRGLRRRSGMTYAEEAYEGMHETKGEGLTAGDRVVNWQGATAGPLTMEARRNRAQSALAAAETAKTRAAAGLEAARNALRSERAENSLETLAKAVTYWQQTAELLRQRLPGGA